MWHLPSIRFRRISYFQYIKPYISILFYCGYISLCVLVPLSTADLASCFLDMVGDSWRFDFLFQRWSSYSECIPSCCGGFQQQNYIPFLRRRGLAMGSSYAILLLFFSFEGAQSYHVQLFQTKNLNQKCECSKYHWKFCLASQNSQFCGVFEAF